MASFPSYIKSTDLVTYNLPRAPSEQVGTYLERVKNIFIEKSFAVQITDYRYFHRHWMGDVVVLVGTSTAGKSSIIKALRQLESDRTEDGIDLRCDITILEHFRKRCPNEIVLLETVMEPLDIPAAMWTRERVWKTEVSDQEKMNAEITIKQMKEKVPEQEIDALFQYLEPQMFDEAFERSRHGESVILDVLEVNAITDHMLMRKFNGPIRIALVYCPFYLLSSRMEKRNQEAEQKGNFSNERVGVFPLHQFSDIYTQKEKQQQTLETITRDQAVKTFDENFEKKVARALKSGRTVSPNEQSESRQKFLDKLGFVEGVDVVEIAPRKQESYHLLINSGVLSAEESAKILHEK